MLKMRGKTVALGGAVVVGLMHGAVAFGDPAAPASAFRDQPLVSSIYTADPSAHVFGGKIYVYPSHDVPTNIPDDDLGNEYAMRDYRVLSMDRIGGSVKVGGVALDVKDVPWASKQMWAPDAAYHKGLYYLYFPARDKARDKEGWAPSASAWRPPKARPARSRPKRRPLRAVSRWTRQSSPMRTARATCISAASGAASCSAGRAAASTRTVRTPI
jgi:hypothetical protein